MFHRCKSLDDAKKLYRSLSMCLHPDKGGSTELMVLLTETYEVVKSELELIQKQNEMKSRYTTPKKETPVAKGKYKYSNLNYVKDEKSLNIIVDMIKNYQNLKDFDPSFLFSVADYVRSRGYCTAAQYNALVNLYERFRFYDIK